MLLDDSIELECYDSSARAEALPVNWDVDLSKIYIPSSILPNRKKQINPNEKKPFILYSLEKPDYNKTVSVYSDECHQNHESQTSTVLSRTSHHKLINDNKNKLEVQQTLPSSQNAVEWNARLDIDSNNVISPKHQVNNKKPGDSLRDCQKTSNPVITNAAQWEKKTSNTSLQDVIYRASLEDLTRRMAEILSEEEPFKENWYHEDVIKTSQVTTSSALDSIPPSTKDSLEELYYSDEDENQFAVEYELNNLELESLEKKPSCSTYTENSYVREQASESFVKSLEQSKNSSDKTAFQSFEETEKNQKVAVDNIFSQSEHGELNGIESEDHTKDSEQELFHCAGELEDPTVKLLEFPIAYKRPPLQEQINKTKPQKGKKKTKKTKKNINLEDFFESEEVDRFKVPEFDEFYENLVRQGKCKPLNQEININGFPSVNFTEELQTIANEFPALNQQDQPQSLFWDSAQTFGESLSSEPQSNSPMEIIRNEEGDGPKLESRDSLDTLIIDNIPLNVSQENIENFILGYGELKNLKIERYEKFQRAKLQMDFMCEVDWIIDCLNGSQPFGSFGKELIKCYRQT